MFVPSINNNILYFQWIEPTTVLAIELIDFLSGETFLFVNRPMIHEYKYAVGKKAITNQRRVAFVVLVAVSPWLDPLHDGIKGTRGSLLIYEDSRKAQVLGIL